MHIGILALYGIFVAAELLVLAMIYATGNFGSLFPAALWMLVDALVAGASIVVGLAPAYRAEILPRLLLFHTAAFAGALIWMGLDAARNASPLSGIFFWGFVGMAGARMLEIALQRAIARPLPWVLLVQSLAVAVLTALLVSALLLPIPPEAARAPVGGFLADPMPPPALARAGVRQ